jgi:hypothetical protein
MLTVVFAAATAIAEAESVGKVSLLARRLQTLHANTAACGDLAGLVGHGRVILRIPD